MKKLSQMAVETPKHPSIDPDEVEKFSRIASEWWDPRGKFRPLHRFNPTRLGFVRDTLVEHFGLDARARKPLQGIRLLDIGCGGGLVSEPMARLGASVTGVDASEKNIKTASVHAEEQGLTIDYRAGAVEGLEEGGEPLFDAVLALEIVEHVADPDAFLRKCAGLVRPGGIMITATINRTPKALGLAIVGAEYLLRWLEPGTHEYSKLVKPSEMRSALEAGGLVTERPVGVSYNPLMDNWSLSSDTKVNYMMIGRKPNLS